MLNQFLYYWDCRFHDPRMNELQQLMQQHPPTKENPHNSKNPANHPRPTGYEDQIVVIYNKHGMYHSNTTFASVAPAYC